MIHLRIVSPTDRTEQAMELLCGIPSVINVIHLPGVAKRPDGDVILCDVAREDASVVLSDLKELDIHKRGSIAMEEIDTHVSAVAEEAERTAPGAVADAVVWEEVEGRTSEQAELSGAFMVFMVLAALIAAVGIFLDSPILVIGGMVVGPEFGPIAGFCVAVVELRGELARRSMTALAIGFPLAILVTYAAVHFWKVTGIAPDRFTEADHSLSSSIANPDVFAVFVALCAGAAGVLSLSTAKSGALIGVLISVATIPAAANVGLSAAYQDWPAFRGSLGQLALNVSAILTAGIVTLWIQRLLYRRRRRRHLALRVRGAAGLPIGRSVRSKRLRGGRRQAG